LKGEIPPEKSFNYVVKSDNGNNLIVERKQ